MEKVGECKIKNVKCKIEEGGEGKDEGGRMRDEKWGWGECKIDRDLWDYWDLIRIGGGEEARSYEFLGLSSLLGILRNDLF